MVSSNKFARAYKEGNNATGFENPSQDMIETYDLMKSNLEEKNALGKITQEEKNTLDILNHMNNNHNIDQHLIHLNLLEIRNLIG